MAVLGELKHATATPETPEISLEEVTRGYLAREAQYKRAEAEYQRRQAEFEARREQRRTEYQEYLQTDEWWERRELVMQRANHLCEGCRLASATEVHHLTYEHCGHEFLWNSSPSAATATRASTKLRTSQTPRPVTRAPALRHADTQPKEKFDMTAQAQKRKPPTSEQIIAQQKTDAERQRSQQLALNPTPRCRPFPTLARRSSATLMTSRRR